MKNSKEYYISQTYSQPITKWEENTRVFSLKLGMRQKLPLFPALFNFVLEFLDKAIKQDKRDKNQKDRNQTTPTCR